jgi:hypothetical protein
MRTENFWLKLYLVMSCVISVYGGYLLLINAEVTEWLQTADPHLFSMDGKMDLDIYLATLPFIQVIRVATLAVALLMLLTIIFARKPKPKYNMEVRHLWGNNYRYGSDGLPHYRAFGNSEIDGD